MTLFIDSTVQTPIPPEVGALFTVPPRSAFAETKITDVISNRNVRLISFCQCLIDLRNLNNFN